MSTATPKAQEILLPVKSGFMVFTLAVAATLNLLPWQGVALLLRPDFVALLILYWCIHQPRRIGMAAAWGLGLLMDVADAALFGQHALAYAALAYSGIVLHRRVLMFSLGYQVLHVIPILLASQLIILLIGLAAGAGFIGWGYFLSSFTGAALWPALNVVLQIPQRPKVDPDSV